MVKCAALISTLPKNTCASTQVQDREKSNILQENSRISQQPLLYVWNERGGGGAKLCHALITDFFKAQMENSLPHSTARNRRPNGWKLVCQYLQSSSARDDLNKLLGDDSLAGAVECQSQLVNHLS